ncbi:SMP-30/gluconolactonase/LRE family protein [Sphingobium aquiterrae]|uniref:SMP-30/gluconolactonase/LRE family protein n=1 Tax=Sphingobium aquiterrae TaxID=2038656 RepID=UPI003018DB8E
MTRRIAETMLERTEVDRRRFTAGAAILGAGLALGGCGRTTIGGGMESGAPTSLALPPGAFSPLLRGLDNPEGIAACPDGRLFFSNGGGAVAVRETDGRVRQIGQPLAPNGVAVDPQGRAIIANMGLLKGVSGSLQRVDVATGIVETLVETLEGRQLVASNGPAVARDGTIYCTHSSWGPVANIGTTTAAGFIYKVAPDGTATIVARGLRGVNGLCLDREERFVYASLTAEARIRRWRRRADGTLDQPEDHGPQLGIAIPVQTVREILAMPATDRAALGYCDGIAFDMAGNLWITLPFSNRIIALTPQRRVIDIVHDPEGSLIDMPTNLCWGGADRRDLYVVSRRGGRILTARTPVAGAPLAHWPAA